METQLIGGVILFKSQVTINPKLCKTPLILDEKFHRSPQIMVVTQLIGV